MPLSVCTVMVELPASQPPIQLGPRLDQPSASGSTVYLVETWRMPFVATNMTAGVPVYLDCSWRHGPKTLCGSGGGAGGRAGAVTMVAAWRSVLMPRSGLAAK